jgi:hypothetical protein
MNRDQWTFRYNATQLAEATRTKIDYHNKCLEFWDGRRTQLIAEIRADGIEVNEKTVLQTPERMNIKGRDWTTGGDVMIRNDLRKSLWPSPTRSSPTTPPAATNTRAGSKPSPTISRIPTSWTWTTGSSSSARTLTPPEHAMGRGESRLRLAPTRNPERPENLTIAYKMHDRSSVASTTAQNLLAGDLELQPSPEPDFEERLDNNQLAKRIQNTR